jgi:uncharacterized protein (TIGR03435 family)
MVSCSLFCQTAFEEASVRPSRAIAGKDGEVTTTPDRFTARNATLKRLIFEAYRTPYSRIEGGPGWLDSDEFDINAEAGNRTNPDRLRLMLQALLADRFKLAVRRETREVHVLALVTAKGGPKLRRAEEANRDASRGPGTLHFHSDLGEFANRLALLLTTPLLNDPATPSRASGPPTPVVDETGMTGIYDFTVDLRPDADADAFTIWQRALEEQLGLRLENRKASVEYLVVSHAEKPRRN